MQPTRKFCCRLHTARYPDNTQCQLVLGIYGQCATVSWQIWEPTYDQMTYGDDPICRCRIHPSPPKHSHIFVKMATQEWFTKIVMIMTNGDIIGGRNEKGDSLRLFIWWLNDYNDDCSHLRGGPFDGELRTGLRCVSVLADKTSKTKVGHLVVNQYVWR